MNDQIRYEISENKRHRYFVFCSRALDSRVFMTLVIGRKEVCLSSCEMVGVLTAHITQHLRLYINKVANPMFFQARTQIGEVLYLISYICVLPREEWEGSSHIIRSTIYSFLLIFLALINRTLLLSYYLGDSFPKLSNPQIANRSFLPILL